jgi:hypothetical protein
MTTMILIALPITIILLGIVIRSIFDCSKRIRNKKAKAFLITIIVLFNIIGVIAYGIAYRDRIFGPE